jgi:hypothetical protein
MAWSPAPRAPATRPPTPRRLTNRRSNLIACALVAAVVAGCGGSSHRGSPSGPTALSTPSAPSTQSATRSGSTQTEPTRAASRPVARRRPLRHARRAHGAPSKAAKPAVARARRVNQHGHHSTIAGHPQTTGNRSSPSPPHHQQAAVVLTPVQARSQVQAACSWYRAQPSAGHGISAGATQTLASALVRLPMIVPDSLVPVRTRLDADLAKLSLAIQRGQTTAASHHATSVRSEANSYATALGVTACI